MIALCGSGLCGTIGRRRCVDMACRILSAIQSRTTDANPDYWVMGWTFETWQLLSDRDNQLTPVLMAWARKFNVQGEDWILAGALQTLSNWHRSAQQRAALDLWGFRQWIAVPGLISDEDHRFTFSDWGWDSTFSSLPVGVRASGSVSKKRLPCMNAACANWLKIAAHFQRCSGSAPTISSGWPFINAATLRSIRSCTAPHMQRTRPQSQRESIAPQDLRQLQSGRGVAS